MDGKMKTNEQKITAACTRALERGKRRVKLPAAVVRQLMTELQYHRTQDEGWRVFAEKRGKTIVELRGQLEDATIKAKDRYEGMVTLTKMVNKMGEAVEKAETRAAAAETYAKQAFEERNAASSRAQVAEQNMHKYRMDAIDAGLDIDKAKGATRNALERATAAEADVLEMADAIRDLRDRVAAAEAATVAATKRAEEAEARVKELGEISDNSYHDYEVATKNAGVMADFIWNLMIEKKVDFIPGTTMNIIDAYKSRND
jgi:chromosome segregation ATPase